MTVVIFLIPLFIAFYTVIFGIENWHTRNRLGFFALVLLAMAVVAVPFYLLFLR